MFHSFVYISFVTRCFAYRAELWCSVIGAKKQFWSAKSVIGSDASVRRLPSLRRRRRLRLYVFCRVNMNVENVERRAQGVLIPERRDAFIIDNI
jgi:hypothetical protein